MHSYIQRNYLCSSIVGMPGTDAFGSRSKQELVRDEVAFAPGIDPHRGLLLMIQRMAEQRVPAVQNATPEEEGHDEREQLPKD